MKDILDDVIRWNAADTTSAVATVIDVEGSAPRPPGAALALSADGTVVGSVSGGCVEGAVYEEGLKVIHDGIPRRLTYGISDDQAFEVGLTCGGTIHLFVERSDVLSRVIDPLRDAVEHDIPAALATVVRGPRLGAKMLVREGASTGSLGESDLDLAVCEDVRGMIDLGESVLRTFGAHGERRREDVEIFVQSFTPPPKMYVFGAIDFAAAVCRIGKFLGYSVTVCDARAPFATKRRFPEADEVVVAWPHEFLRNAPVDGRTSICVLTHDPKFDVPLLKAALATDAGYIGAMGSRRTHDRRTEELVTEGLSPDVLARIRGPIGLDIGATAPEEVAVSIAAEIIGSRNRGTWLPLSRTEGPIHLPRRVGSTA